jgi:hypothetical protein
MTGMGQNDKVFPIMAAVLFLMTGMAMPEEYRADTGEPGVNDESNWNN